MMQSKMTRRLAFVFCIAVLAWGCGKQPTDTSAGTDTSIMIERNISVPSSTESVVENTTEQRDIGETEEHIVPAPAVTTYQYPIEELGIQLEIPENIYTYRINGIYRDWTGKLNIHHFSEWIVLSCKEYDECELEQALRDNYLEESKHIAFVLSISSEQLYPARRLCYGLFADGDVRKNGSNYFERLNCSVVNSDTVAAIGAYSFSGKDGIAVSEKWSAWIDKWKFAVDKATLPTVDLSWMTDTFIAPDGLEEWSEAYADTIVVEEVWDSYQRAVQELTNQPEKYVYADEEIFPLVAELEDRAIQKSKSDRNLAEARLISVYANSTQDIYVRAYCYTRCARQVDREVGLDDIIVILQDWEDDRQSYVGYCKEEDGNYTKVAVGYNYFNDLQASRDYILHEIENQETTAPETEAGQYEADENVMKAEFNVVLKPYPDHLVVFADDVSMTEDGYCIRGSLYYGGDIVIPHSDKAVLDAGGIMHVIYEGQEVVSITSYLNREDTYSIVKYTDSEGMKVKLIPFAISRMDTVVPKIGEFKLANESIGDYNLVLDHDYQITVPAETPTYPKLSYLTEHMLDSDASGDDVEPMAFSEYYQMMLDRNENLNWYYHIYLQDGQIVKIEQVAF